MYLYSGSSFNMDDSLDFNIDGCVFLGNTGITVGGALAANTSLLTRITNNVINRCTFRRNEVVGLDGDGGAVHFVGAGAGIHAIRLSDVLVTDNTAGRRAGGMMRNFSQY